MSAGSYAVLDEHLWFPQPEEADEEGLLAIGGDLSPERLLLAYKNGIFPWYEGKVPLWWNPDPRFVLFPEELKVSKSMKQVLRQQSFTITHNQAFEQVIAQCRKTPRPGQDGTWIGREVVEAYTELHLLGIAHSFEAWQQQELVGGFYGLHMGQVFFGESMFSHVSNASKAAFITGVQQMQAEGLRLIDCQVHTTHLESLGARMIERVEFLDLLKKWIK
jgi:leucyl/phenylalanyl-tRNA---protein transferase